jgi:hypothetical protein
MAGSAAKVSSNQFGDSYVIDFELVHKGAMVLVRSHWMIKRGETAPKLVTAFVKD